MQIVEQLTRKGNEILYEMTIHDSESFVEPWVMPARTLRPGERRFDERASRSAVHIPDL